MKRKENWILEYWVFVIRSRRKVAHLLKRCLIKLVSVEYLSIPHFGKEDDKNMRLRVFSFIFSSFCVIFHKPIAFLLCLFCPEIG